MKVGELREPSESFWVHKCEVVVRKVQIKQAFHASKGAAFNFTDFAKLQVKGNDLAGSREAVGRKVVEVVAAKVEQLRLGRETLRDFGVTPTLACGMLGLSLERGKSQQNRKNRRGQQGE